MYGLAPVTETAYSTAYVGHSLRTVSQVCAYREQNLSFRVVQQHTRVKLYSQSL